MQDHTRNNGNSREMLDKLNGAAGGATEAKANGNSVGNNNGLRLVDDSTRRNSSESTNGKLNGKLNGSTKAKLNGNTNGKLNGKLNGNVNGKLSFESIEKYIPYYTDRSFSFSIQIPQNVVVRAVNVLGMEAATLVDGLRLPGNYVVILNKETTTPGLYFYKLYVQVDDENDPDSIPLSKKPGKRYRLVQEKEIVLT
jgi:hypothetical protein